MTNDLVYFTMFLPPIYIYIYIYSGRPWFVEGKDGCSCGTVRKKQLLFLMSNKHVTILHHFWLLVMLNLEQGGWAPKSPFGLNWNPAEEGGGLRQNKWHVLRLPVKVCFRKAFCEYLSLCMHPSVELCLSLGILLSLTSMCLWLQACIPVSLPPCGCCSVTSRCNSRPMVRYPVKPQSTLYDEAPMSVLLYVY